MKIALVCDWLVTLGGAEKVIKEILTCFPDADVFSVVDFVEDSKRDFLHNKKTTTTFIQKLPFAKKKYRAYLPLMPLAIEQLDLSAYDIVISSSHAVAKGVITGPNQLHISYVHSPMRYAWDMQHQYLRETGLDKKTRGWLARYFLHKLRQWDFRSAAGVDHFIANSNYIAKRIEKTYRRDAEVIHPPVDVAKFTPRKDKEDFYLTASRLVPYKKIDLIVESFKDMPDKRLIVIGDGPEMAKVKSKAGSNVTLLGYQPDEVMVDHLQRANAFIFAAEEDFGILPLEAQACGTPVIAYGKGGALETVRGTTADKLNAEDSDPKLLNFFRSTPKTGVFFPEQTTQAIQQAIETFENHRALFTADNCVNHAKQFAPENFRQKLKLFIASKMD